MRSEEWYKWEYDECRRTNRRIGGNEISMLGILEQTYTSIKVKCGVKEV